MRVSDVMHVQLVTCNPEESVLAAVGRMVEARVGCILVVGSDGRLEGLLSERDILRLVVDRADMAHVTVGATMTRDVLTVDGDTELAWAAGAMTERHIRHLPIVDDGHPTGILSMRDLLDLSVEVLRLQGPAAASEVLREAAGRRGVRAGS
jgi:CBS domain-containing protein